MTRTLAIAIIFISLMAAACHKGGSEIKQVSPEEAKKNAELEKTAPHLAPTAIGAAERINLALTGSMDAYRQRKWSEVVTYLNTARQETEKAMADTPGNKERSATYQTFAEMKDALDRTIQAADNRSPDVEAQLNELQTRAGALKVIVQQTQPPQPR